MDRREREEYERKRGEKTFKKTISVLVGTVETALTLRLFDDQQKKDRLKSDEKPAKRIEESFFLTLSNKSKAESQRKEINKNPREELLLNSVSWEFSLFARPALK